jgi:hypothetical protein
MRAELLPNMQLINVTLLSAVHIPPPLLAEL